MGDEETPDVVEVPAEDLPALDLDLSLEAATRLAIASSPRLRDPQFRGALVNLLRLARKIDAWDTIVQWALDDVAGKGRGGRPAVPQNDNVSVSAYAKQAEQLGLTPSGRKALGQPLRDFNEPDRDRDSGTPEGKEPASDPVAAKLTLVQGFRDEAAAAR